MKAKIYVKMTEDKARDTVKKIVDEYYEKVDKVKERIKNIPNVILMGAKENILLNMGRLEFSPLWFVSWSEKYIVVDVNEAMFQSKAMKLMGANQNKVLHELMQAFDADSGEWVIDDVVCKRTSKD